ncbi:hypothetical protein WA158_004255 [Blastocystis sp. Blastoise]
MLSYGVYPENPYTSSFSQLILSDSNKYLASSGSGSDNRVITIWESNIVDRETSITTKQDKELFSPTSQLFLHHASISSMAFIPYNNLDWLALASFDKTISLWNISDRKCTTLLDTQNTGLSHGIHTLLSCRYHSQIAAAGDGGLIDLYDIPSFKYSGTLKGHQSDIRTMAYVPLFQSTSSLLITSSYDSTIKFWDMQNTNQITSLTLGSLYKDASTLYTSQLHNIHNNINTNNNYQDSNNDYNTHDEDLESGDSASKRTSQDIFNCYTTLTTLSNQNLLISHIELGKQIDPSGNIYMLIENGIAILQLDIRTFKVIYI